MYLIDGSEGSNVWVILVKEKQALYNYPWQERHQTQEADLKRQGNE